MSKREHECNLGGMAAGVFTVVLSTLYTLLIADPLGTPSTIDSEAECVCAGIAFVIAAIGVCTFGVSTNIKSKESK